MPLSYSGTVRSSASSSTNPSSSSLLGLLRRLVVVKPQRDGQHEKALQGVSDGDAGPQPQQAHAFHKGKVVGQWQPNPPVAEQIGVGAQHLLASTCAQDTTITGEAQIRAEIQGGSTAALEQNVQLSSAPGWQQRCTNKPHEGVKNTMPPAAQLTSQQGLQDGAGPVSDD